MAGRTLADFGATVFKVVTKKRPRRELYGIQVRDVQMQGTLAGVGPMEVIALREPSG